MNNPAAIHDRKSYFLQPAEFYMTSEPILIKTVLGSCITVTMRCRRTGLAAACHALLPKCGGCSCPPQTCLNKYKFVSCVLPEMVRRFRESGIPAEDIEIKLFGGADMIMFRRNSRSYDNQRVGRKNILKAREIARNLNMSFTRADVGGTLGRTIYFDTETGEVWLKRLCKPVPNKGLM